RERVKVVLSGEGADEVLAGYSLDRSLRHFETLKRIQTVPPTILRLMSRALTWCSEQYAEKLARAVSIPLSEWNAVHRHHMTWFWNERDKAALWPTFAGRDSAGLLQAMYGRAASPHPLDQTLSVYQQAWLVEDLLMKADKMSMAASLELRVPYLD